MIKQTRWIVSLTPQYVVHREPHIKHEQQQQQKKRIEKTKGGQKKERSLVRNVKLNAFDDFSSHY